MKALVVMSILRDEVGVMEVYSIDEAFLELGDGLGVEEAHKIERREGGWNRQRRCRH